MILKELSEPQYDRLIKFLTQFDISARSERFWHDRLLFWWDKNPAFISGTTKGWILLVEEEIVGFIGHIPLHFQLSGKKLKVFAGTTWYVKKKYRNQSIRLLFKSIKTSNQTILFSTTASTEVAKINKSLNYLPIMKQEKIRYSFVIINTFKYLRSRFNTWPISKVPAFFLSPILKFIQTVMIMGGSCRNVKKIEHADESFNELWERTKHVYKNTNIRTNKIINWYCFGSEYFKKILFGYYFNNKLFGYAIFISKNKNLKELELVDLWVDPARKECIKQLLNYSIRYAKKNRYDRVIYPHWSPEFENQLKAYKLFKSRTISANRYYKTNDALNNDIANQSSYFVGIQGDYGL